MKKFLFILIGVVCFFAIVVAAYFTMDALFTPIDTNYTEISEESAEPEKPKDPFLGAPVPKNEIPQGEEWFNDAIFIGDSLTVGLGAYKILDENLVFASTGINPQTILTKACVEKNGTTLTVADAIKDLTPKKIYIMLGSNGVAFLSKEKVIELYGEFIDSVKTSHPDSQIYLQSIMPVTSSKEKSDDRYANSKIDEYNEAILDLANKKEVYFVNVAEAVKDENGCLPDSSSSDGMHFGPSVYNLWLDYLREHYVPLQSEISE